MYEMLKEQPPPTTQQQPLVWKCCGALHHPKQQRQTEVDKEEEVDTQRVKERKAPQIIRSTPFKVFVQEKLLFPVFSKIKHSVRLYRTSK